MQIHVLETLVRFSEVSELSNIWSLLYKGGPLMWFNKSSSTFSLIGTVNGNGFDCTRNETIKFENSENGLWNKISAHMVWIEQTMTELGEKVCITNKHRMLF